MSPQLAGTGARHSSLQFCLTHVNKLPLGYVVCSKYQDGLNPILALDY
jgi:hypothetical protein